MSKYVKNLVADHLRDRLKDVGDALLVNVVGLDANANNRLRTDLEAKNIRLMVVKNSLAARATAGTSLAPMFEGLSGSAAVCWGGEDIVSLAREITRLARDEQYAPLEARGGVMGGDRLSAEEVVNISNWPSRREQMSLLVGQILGPGAVLAGQLCGPASTLAGQIAQRAEERQQASETGGPDA